MKVVYLVTTGDYSDYSVHAGFSSKADADLYAASIELADVQEIPLDPELGKVRDGLFFWDVIIQRDGDVIRCGKRDMLREERPHRIPAQWSEFSYAGFSTWAKDEQQAIKAANEWRAQMIALGRWP